jgi:RND family efflux transporter MFP subunit
MTTSTLRHQPRARFIARFVVPIGILATTVVILAIASRDALQPTSVVEVTPVVVVESVHPSARAEGGLQAPGWLEPAPYASEIRALREGVIAEVHALEGSKVAADELLATLERGAESIALARAEAAARLAEADVAAKRAARDAAARTLELALDAEQKVREAEAALSDAEAMRAKLASEIAEAEASEAEARDEHERKSQLVAAGSVSVGDVRRLGLRVAALAARTESLRSERSAREARVVRAQGDLAAARTARRELIDETRARDESEAMLLAATAALDVARAARDEAQLALARSEIRAPRAGTVMHRMATPGSRVGGDSGALFQLYDPASLQVRCDVPLKDAGRLRVGLDAEIRVDALPDRVFRGRVTRIVPQADIQKNTVQCKVAVDDPDAALTPEMLARVRIATDPSERRSEAIAIPVETLRTRDADRGTVLVAIPDGAAARAAIRGVTLGAERANGWIEVLDGLAAGDRVVLDAGIADGARLAPSERTKEEAP